MLKIYRYDALGYVDHGWLQARHHFSFGNYFNPARTNFGALRVINDDIISAGTGFATHPHRDMEIITYVRQGAITHRDSENNQGRTAAGDVQVMSAGSGVFHSEHNLEKETTRLFQIWIVPNQLNVKPRWEAREFPKTKLSTHLIPLVSGYAEHIQEGALMIYQNAVIFGGALAAGTQITHPILQQAYLLVSSGSIKIDGQILHEGDGAEISNAQNIEINALSDTSVLVIDVPCA